MGNDWPKNDEKVPRDTTIITVERARGEIVNEVPFKGTNAQIKKEIEKQQRNAGAEYDVLEKLPNGN